MSPADLDYNSKTGYSQQDTKHNNTMLIFDAIRTSGKVSRVSVSGMTGLSTSTVSELVDDLLRNGLVIETGSEVTKTRGRKPISLMVNPEGAYIIVVEIINTGYNCYLCNLACEIIDKTLFRIAIGVEHNLCKVVAKLLAEHGIDSSKLMGICIDYPGICDTKNSRLVTSIVVDSESYLNNNDIEKLQSQYPNAKVMVDNDSTIAAYSSFRFTDSHFGDVVLFLNMYECIGAGAIVSNEKGENIYNFPVEIGQMVLSGSEKIPSGRETFEKLVGALAVFRRVNEETDLHVDYTEEYMTDINFSSMKYLGEELEKGNEKLEVVLRNVAHITALAITNVCNIIDSDNIYIGGMFKYLGKHFVELIRREMSSIKTIPSVGERKIHLSKLDHHTKIMGAANMVTDKIFGLK